MPPTWLFFLLLAVLGATSTVPCRVLADTSTPFYATRFERTPSAAELTALGRALFAQRALSITGRSSCWSCHDPLRAFGPANSLAVQLGGAEGTTLGLRAAPSLRYLQAVPPFTEHFFESDGNDSEDQGPAGGRTWDGRAASAHEQARLPLLSPQEMANSSEASVVERLAGSSTAAAFKETFGAHVFDDTALAFRGLLLALEVYQQDPRDFYPYTSKYDAYLRGKAKLNPVEARGLTLFSDPAKGNCARCHPNQIKEGALPQLTDFGYAALGLPRNPAIAANRDAAFFDMGLCGPLRIDLGKKTEYCGMFRVPSLRNVALHGTYFHNGSVATLRDAVRFYAERDVRPAKWYPLRADGSVERFNDLPPAYRDNVEMKPPFGGTPGSDPALDDSDIDAIVAYLETLTDGWTPDSDQASTTRLISPTTKR